MSGKEEKQKNEKKDKETKLKTQIVIESKKESSKEIRKIKEKKEK